ncbi:DNA polymerase III subunit beta [Streptomyces sp. SID685]|uniref:DNA polymerase III subunit beta n=1 Tax=Streptomyces sp. SID685 TaxID=2690322 RepID=UPI00136EB022|nr:DNA polymerase III subunit beta [Streptomyces sp. SID685]MYR83839.1 DNA polymerase III subunit beta [Streptomyces sp. SID685]
MKLRLDQKQLADAARRAHRRLPNNPLRPVLSGLLIEASSDTVTLSGFDLETATRATLDAETLEPGETVVPGRLLADVAAALPAGPVDLVADEHEATITAPGTSFTLPTLPRREYPALPEPPGASGVVDGDRLATVIGHAAQAAMAEKEAVGTMTGFGGVHVRADGDQLIVSASDRYRIVRHTLPWQPDGERAGELLLPAPGFAVTAKQMAGHPVRIAFAEGTSGVAALATERLTVTDRTLAVDFPDIARFFPDPAAAAGWMRADADELAEAVKRAALVNEKPEQPIMLTFDRDEVTVRGGVEGSKGASRIAAETADLDGFEIAYRPDFLSSLLTPVDGLVQMWFTTATKPALLAPVDDDTYRAVCMPVRLPK